MNVGDVTTVKGFFTKEKFVAGRTLRELEKALGYNPGRFSKGIIVLNLLQMPSKQDFSLAGYSNVAGHRWKEPTDLDVEKLKANAMQEWKLSGQDRLVKIWPNIPHDPSFDPDFQYPPGGGVPQWKSKVSLPAKVSGIVTQYPNGYYRSPDVLVRY
jgi:hypothetical protein